MQHKSKLNSQFNEEKVKFWKYLLTFSSLLCFLISYLPCVVTRENNNSTAAHAGHKRQPNGYPVPGGRTGPPCPGHYKYGVLTLQFGGWATGQQTITVKKPTVRKPKLWPQKSQTEWKWPRQWKRVNEMWTAILNVYVYTL